MAAVSRLPVKALPDLRSKQDSTLTHLPTDSMVGAANVFMGRGQLPSTPLLVSWKADRSSLLRSVRMISI